MNEPWTSGEFVTRKITRPAVELSGQNFVDTSTGDWETGSFVTKKITQAANELSMNVPALKLTVSCKTGTNLQDLFQATLNMMNRVLQLGSDVGLTLQDERTEQSNDATGRPIVVFYFIPKNASPDLLLRYQSIQADVNGTLQDVWKQQFKSLDVEANATIAA